MRKEKSIGFKPVEHGGQWAIYSFYLLQFIKEYKRIAHP